MPLPNFHAARVVSPGRFQEGSFRVIQIGDKDSGIKAIVGRLKGEKTATVQSYRFDKDKFTAAEAKKWLSEHDVKPLEFEPAKQD